MNIDNIIDELLNSKQILITKKDSKNNQVVKKKSKIGKRTQKTTKSEHPNLSDDQPQAGQEVHDIGEGIIDETAIKSMLNDPKIQMILEQNGIKLLLNEHSK